LPEPFLFSGAQSFSSGRLRHVNRHLPDEVAPTTTVGLFNDVTAFSGIGKLFLDATKQASGCDPTVILPKPPSSNRREHAAPGTTSRRSVTKRHYVTPERLGHGRAWWSLLSKACLSGVRAS